MPAVASVQESHAAALPRNRRRHDCRQGAGRGRFWRRRRRGRIAPGGVGTEARLGGARSRRLVAGYGRGGPCRLRRGVRPRRRGRRPVGPDAQLRAARRLGHCAEAGDSLERRPHHGPVPLHYRDARQDRPAQARGQSGARGLHRAQAPLGARRGAPPVRPDPDGAAAQGLRPPADDRREGHRAVGRRRHPAVRHTAGPLVG